ncbi:hypothetical protein BSL78_09020 [Apostichopus japonicus]|uniref:Receptor-type tyrosine-protein phosphatase N2 n=1 Tax=Stichopus japonicus TaxID=307972 RepID=A0A2G8L1J2_STIJA|nr:hypothetical protein BSL78_09020 [Apostichopus japonicus]
MASGFLFLTRLVALLTLVTGSPYGNVGCHFSPVCKSDEICADDNLFGSCVSVGSSHLPFYDLDPRGLRELKGGIKFLIDEGYQWKDEFSQDILRKVLFTYQLDYPSQEYPFLSGGYNDLSPVQSQGELARASLHLLWKGNGAPPPVRSKKYAANDRYQTNNYRASVSDIVEEYMALLEELEESRQNSLQQRFQDYYARYSKLLDRYNQYRDQRVPLTMGDEGYQDDPQTDELGDKMNLIQDYLRKVYTEKFGEDGNFVDGAWVRAGKPRGKVKEDEEGEIQTPGEDGDVDVGDADREDGDTIRNNLAAWIEDGASSSSSSAPVDEDGFLESSSTSDSEVTFLALLGEQLVPFLNEADREEWQKLTEEEKIQMLEEVLATVQDGEAVVDEGDGRDGSLVPQFDPNNFDGGLGGDFGKVEELESAKGNNPEEPPKQSGDFQEKELFLTGQVGQVEKKAEDVETLTVELPKGDSANTEKPITTAATTSKPKTTPPATGYAYIALKDKISQEDAESLVSNLAFLLEVPSQTFSKVRSHGSEVTFFVNSNDQKMSPAIVATSAAENGKTLEAIMQVDIKETGVGKEVETGESLKDEDNTALVVLTVILSLCVLLILIVVVSIYCIRKRSNFQAKLKGLSGKEETEPEAKSDYQDLCRQRMATKQTEKPEPLSRISSIAQSEGAQPSPSSRSSTSSWSEEPVQSNMDISTGHVVLTYMEDHLQNQDRLSKEWEALCTYEPDGSSTAVGREPKNTSRNRFTESLPYDHSRIILNENVNSAGSDYINANAIVDSDPKAPAYIATQAPLPNTLGDFWQMVWEQGSVVIVNLTHLSESEILKTPYWPNKGSAIYHIYELHLVSEHVWCDDYLVRSFYLKNLETQETRTVTQFHFLSWTKDGVPSSPKALLEFRRKVNKSFRGRQCPIIVHCNDGVGRTGTYILIDLVLTRMTKGAKEIDIAATLEHIRDHRETLVRTKEQFEFALTAVAEEVNAILKALPQ